MVKRFVAATAIAALLSTTVGGPISGFWAARSWGYIEPYCGEVRPGSSDEAAAAMCDYIWDSHAAAGLYTAAAFGPGAAAAAFIVGVGYIA